MEAIAILAYFLFSPILAYQTTLNSTCDTFCSSDSSPNIVGLKLSTSDIVCSSSEYSNTTVGVKFRQCIDCLQNSPATKNAGSDLEWFLYNLRFSINTCVFNSLQPSTAVSACAPVTHCGRLQAALEYNLQNETPSTQYSYCSAFDNSFLGTSLGLCQVCLKKSSGMFLSNFLVALNAGCVERAPPGTLLGLDGTLFSSYPVNITFLRIPANSTNGKRLSPSGIVAITVIAGFSLVLIAVVLTYIHKKRLLREGKEREKISISVGMSKIDKRFRSSTLSGRGSTRSLDASIPLIDTGTAFRGLSIVREETEEDSP